MARDTKKYVYYTVAILRDSPLHKELLEEAEELGKKQVPTMIAIWLRDYRHLRKLGVMSTLTMTPTQKVDNQESNDFDLSNAAEADDAWPDD